MVNYRRSVEKEAVWRGHLKQQARGGLSIREYCHQNQVSEASFYVWRREIARRDQERNRNVADRSETQTAAASDSKRHRHGGLVAVDVIDVAARARGSIEICLAHHVVIRLREDVAAEVLDRVLGAAADQSGRLTGENATGSDGRGAAC